MVEVAPCGHRKCLKYNSCYAQRQREQFQRSNAKYPPVRLECGHASCRRYEHCVIEYRKKYRAEHVARLAELRERWKQNNPERVKELHKRYRQKNFLRLRDAKNAKRKEWGQKWKAFVVGYYSDGKNACKCCGETIMRFLTVDHIDGKGKEHRMQIKSAGQGSSIYLWIMRNGFPAGFQILCYNCNIGKGRGEKCPHEIAREQNVIMR